MGNTILNGKILVQIVQTVVLNAQIIIIAQNVLMIMKFQILTDTASINVL